MSKSKIITVVMPINMPMIKCAEDPNMRNIYPNTDYLTATLDSNVIYAKASVCARREFTHDEFWLNGKRNVADLAFCLNEVKFMAAIRHTVSDEFLTRKVHIACENSLLSSSEPASITAGFLSLMTALYDLYKIVPRRNNIHSIHPNIVNSQYGGFVQRRQLYPKRNFNGKQIAKGKHWPELRVLIIFVNDSKKTKECARGDHKSAQYVNRSAKDSLPKHLKKKTKAIKEKNFATFAEESMKDDKQTAHKNKTAYKIMEVIYTYNEMFEEAKATSILDTKPYVSLFFLEKHAQEVISLIKHVFPSSKPDFIRGLEAPSDLDAEHFQNFPIAPKKPDRINYAIYSKLGGINVKYDTDHLLDDNGELKVKSAGSSPSKETVTSSEDSDAPGSQ